MRMIRVVLCLVTVLIGVSASIAQQPPSAGYVRPDDHERVAQYLKNMFGPASIAKNAASAGITTWQNAPEEWGTHWDGFGKRFASNMGKSVIKNTAAFGLEEAFKLDSRYYRSSGGKGAKIKNAITSPFIARNEHGKKVFGFPRIVGTYSASVIAAEAWYPARYSWKDGMRSGTISLGTSMLFNVVKEFVHR